MNLLKRREWMFLALILVYSFVPTFGGLMRVGELVGGTAIIPGNPRAIDQPIPIILHILSSFVFCLVGALQFLPSIRRQHNNWHRVIGRFVAIAGVLSAFTGLWMTTTFAFPQELQGTLLYWARITFGIAMIGLIFWAIVMIRAHNLSKHGKAMVRAYAIGQGASTQTFLGIGWIIVAGTEPFGFTRDLLMVSAWILNLVLAELLISRIFTQGQAGISNRPPDRELQSSDFR